MNHSQSTLPSKAINKHAVSPHPGEGGCHRAMDPAADRSRRASGASGQASATAGPTAPDAARGPAAPPPRWASPFPPDVVFEQAGPEAIGRMALLPGERALLSERAAARRVLEFTLGRGCARAALAVLAAPDPRRAAELAATPLLREDARRPRWPAGFVGAITHHRGWAAAAVARAQAYLGIGVDLEALRAPSPGLLARILRPEERERWQALPAAERPGAFMRVFSAKESLFKALYPHGGVYLGFQDATVTAAPGSAAAPADSAPEAAQDTPPGALALRWRLERDAGPGLPAGRTGDGCALARAGYVLTGIWLRRD